MTNCLSYNQLEAYALGRSDRAERARLYIHISACEMCACAVNGFSAVPFTSDELVAIHREIDVRANIAAAKPLTLAQVFIIIISVSSIFGVYAYSESAGTTILADDKAERKEITLKEENNEKKSESQKEISAVAKTFKKTVNRIRQVKFERKLSIPGHVDPLDPISVILTEPENTAKEPDDLLLQVFNSDVIYIYDLKITDYNKLYFGTYKSAIHSFKTHTPVFKENKTSLSDDFGVEREIIPADKVLKEGLAAFNKHKHHHALENFELLLANNPADVNARFYAALSCYNLHRYEKAIAYLNDVLSGSNNTFQPEAQWYLALSYIRSGNRPSGKQLLEMIVSSRGFYSRKAAEKLKTL